ncbi:yjeF C-terminal region, hydroxyethylthiazole kinase-related/yjeF N-terminal region [Nocardioides alpinus]|uniref:Bifunctional NAD(P)H-hydrate repair enzyme n=1 Tax=Nocardioides alpinus TaxID=748909 RepID=A0A1I0YMM9_9ACTN|nr:NAD(P)H-hydrate dehydratase [Nocardioides alpinus]PKH43569.1 NAD(P)H-hydrate dehydratase [Nocardioides alpinus]SFB13578.1 yjeF C-terminal region, hydroxyethylthiazole kinase-related/yjeF N-terminal region [Nocardioides alpinus]
MLRAHTVEDVRRAEAAAMADLPDGALMQRAAAGLAAAVVDLLDGAYGRRVVLLVGPGDNGGDALWAGARLAGRGARVEALLLADRVHAGGLAALRAAGGLATRDPDDLSAAPDLLVDGIVGIGGRPGLRPEAAAALARFPAVPVVAVDVPSGVDVDTGRLDGPHVRADLTVTFGTHKVAHLVDPAATASGALHLVDLGLDPDELGPPALEALQPDDVRALLPRPGPDAQKYTRGVVGVRAGSGTYPGAALLAVSGAGCGLVGMVRYLGPEHIADTVRTAHPEVVGAGRVQAWVVGPGGGDDAGSMLAEARADGVPVVVDADALRHVDAPMPGCVLTPHAGELAAMTGVERAEIEADPLHHAREAARRWDCVVLLKGHHTLVADPAGRVRVTTTGVPWLATAGAGDVLAGLVGALLAAGLEPYDAASVGSWVHGAAATEASAGGPLTAGGVAVQIPRLVRATLNPSGSRPLE